MGVKTSVRSRPVKPWAVAAYDGQSIVAYDGDMANIQVGHGARHMAQPELCLDAMASARVCHQTVAPHSKPLCSDATLTVQCQGASTGYTK